jgi:prevent-host-death family protein
MRSIHIAEDIIPVGQFKAKLAGFLQQPATTGRPLVVTQNGSPSAVVLSPAQFDALTEHQRFVAAVEEGLRQADAGQTIADEDLDAWLTERTGAP